MTDRNAIRERLRRLLAMTVENGATEAEALIAARKAAELMAEHNLSYRSVEEIEAENYSDDARPWFRGSKGRSRSAPVPPIRRCLNEISELCGVEHSFNTYTGNLMFFGAAHDTEAAHYLVIILSRAMEREWHTYSRLMPPVVKRGARASFFLGISCRIALRLTELAAEQERAATGNALVLVKNALVKERFAERHPGLKTLSAPRAVGNPGAVLAGWEAGANVAINTGVNEAQGAKLIASGGEAR